MKVGDIYRNNKSIFRSLFVPLKTDEKMSTGIVMTLSDNDWYIHSPAEFFNDEIFGEEPRFEKIGEWRLFKNEKAASKSEDNQPVSEHFAYQAIVTKPSFLSPYWIYRCPRCGNAFRIPKHDRVFANYCVDCGYKFWGGEIDE